MVEQVGPVYLNRLTIGEANAKLREVFGQIYAGVSGDSPHRKCGLRWGRLRTIQVNVMGEVETPGTYRSVVVFDGLPCAVPRWGALLRSAGFAISA